MNFSIIIATKNRPQKIKSLLNQLQSQKFPPNNFEVIVIDNGSNNNIFKQLLQTQEKFKQLRIYKEARPGSSFARNTGVANANYSYIIFLDDDVLISNTFLESYSQAWEKYPHATAIGGKIRPVLRENHISKSQQTIIEHHSWCFSQINYGDKDKPLRLGEMFLPPILVLKSTNQKEKCLTPDLGKKSFTINI